MNIMKKEDGNINWKKIIKFNLLATLIITPFLFGYFFMKSEGLFANLEAVFQLLSITYILVFIFSFKISLNIDKFNVKLKHGISVAFIPLIYTYLFITDFKNEGFLDISFMFLIFLTISGIISILGVLSSTLYSKILKK